MSQQQPPRRPPLQQQQQQEQPIKYGDVFDDIEGDFADKPVAPKDAAMMQSAENQMLGKTLKGGAASVMQSAAMKNERAGVVGHSEMTDVAGDEGVTVTETDLPGKFIVTEAIGEQVVGQYSQPAPLQPIAPPSTYAQGTGQGSATGGGITIGEALEATAITAGEKPVEWSDVAAIQAAEVRATGQTTISSGGVGAAAQSAANLNARATRDEDKTKLADILTDATTKLPADKPATRRDAEGVASAELRNDPKLTTYPGGVAASVAAAARLNQMKENKESHLGFRFFG